jgi:RHS repeat-associated protein
LYPDRLYQEHFTGSPPVVATKHIFVGQTRIVSKIHHSTVSNESQRIGYMENNTFTYHADHLGSTNWVTDNDGRGYEHFQYTPYGEPWVDESFSNKLATMTHRFTGQELDRETGLYSFPARYYDPQTSRWMGADPAGSQLMMPMDREGNMRAGFSIVESTNWYSYVSNNPLKYSDPTGMIQEVGDGVFYDIETGGFYDGDGRSVKDSTFIHIQRSAGHTDGHYQSRLEVRAGDNGNAVLFSADVQSWADLESPEGLNYYTVPAGPYEGRLYGSTGSYDKPIGLVNESLGVDANNLVLIHANQRNRTGPAGVPDANPWVNGNSGGCQILCGGFSGFGALTNTLEAAGFQFGAGYMNYTDTINVRISDPPGFSTTSDGREIRKHGM